MPNIKRTLNARLLALHELRIEPQEARPDGLVLPSRAAEALGVGYDILAFVVRPVARFNGSIGLYDPRDLVAQRYEVWARNEAREQRRRQRELKREAALCPKPKPFKGRRPTAWERILKG